MVSRKIVYTTETELVAALRLGKSEAVRQWFFQYHQPLLVVAIKKLPSEIIAEELVQETFIHSLQQLPLFKQTASLMTWMQSILRHEIADYYRKQYAKKAIKIFPLSELLLNQPVADAHESSVLVRQVLAKMLKPNVELLLMKYVDGKKVKEIAAELGRTVKAVESDLFRARSEFRALYAQLESEIG